MIGGSDVRMKLEKAVALWSEATDAVLKREDALVHLALFAQKALAPERLLDRRAQQVLPQHERVAHVDDGVLVRPREQLVRVAQAPVPSRPRTGDA